MARKCPEEGDDAATERKERESEKEALLHALSAKCTALIEDKADKISILKAFTELREWVDTTSDPKYAVLHAKKECFEGHFALAIQALDKVCWPLKLNAMFVK